MFCLPVCLSVHCVHKVPAAPKFVQKKGSSKGRLRIELAEEHLPSMGSPDLTPSTAKRKVGREWGKERKGDHEKKKKTQK